MIPHHHETDHLPGEPRPGTGILSLRVFATAALVWIAIAFIVAGIVYAL